MYKEILQSIDNIQVWPVISFVIFFVFFLALIWWAVMVDRNYISTMKKMPLNDDTLHSESAETNFQSSKSMPS